MNFDDTMTEADFRPLLEPNEERMLSTMLPDQDMTVDGLESTLLSRLAGLFTARKAR